MERFILKKLLDWKNSPYRKPLILKGVRQVGKTLQFAPSGGRKCVFQRPLCGAERPLVFS